MAYSLAFWICFLATFVAALAQVLFIARLRKELARLGRASNGNGTGSKHSTRELLLLHKSEFPVSATRRLYSVSRGAQILAALAAVVFIVVAQFQPGNPLHLIPIGR